MWTVGQNVGSYEIVAKLREGGMATLYLARQTGPVGLARHVAIKVIHPLLANDEQFRQMFLDEAMLTSRIEHPNVVRVEELGQHDNAHFLTMEFVHGCSLAQLSRVLLEKKRRLSPAFATRIAMHVAEGLHAAHEIRDERGRPLNLVHRDVTPENILLAYHGHVKLIDFGIAKAYGRRHRTQDGLLKGKFRYMAPEQALSKNVDRRVDIYQLGIVLWEMLTLRRLFAAERDIDLLASVQRPKVDPPSRLVDRIPAALDAAVMAALDPDPRRRPPDGQSFARLLARAVPAAHEVDAGALQALLAATMNDHRQRERVTYPPGLYERLDQQVVGRATQPLESALPVRRAPEARSPDGEPTERFASDSPGRAARSGDEADSSRRRRGRALRGRRPLELVRFASEVRTRLTLIAEAGFVGSRLYWIAIGGAVGLFAALAVIALALRPHARNVPGLPLPPVAMQRAAHVPALPSLRVPTLQLQPVQPAPTPVVEQLPDPERGCLGSSPQSCRTEEQKRARREARARRRSELLVEPTPLLTDSGF